MTSRLMPVLLSGVTGECAQTMVQLLHLPDTVALGNSDSRSCIWQVRRLCRWRNTGVMDLVGYDFRCFPAVTRDCVA